MASNKQPQRIQNITWILVTILVVLTSTIKVAISQSACTLQFVASQPGQVSIQATAQPNTINTNASCASLCLSNSDCFSYQIDSNPGSPSICWLQFQASRLTTLSNQNNVQEFVKQCQACQLTFVQQTDGVASISATQRNNLTSVSCASNCLVDYRCLSYQIDNSTIAGTSICWHQLSALLPVFSRPLVTEFVKACASVQQVTTACPPSFIAQKPGVASLGATLQTGTSLALCPAACLANAQCLSYQLDVSIGGLQLCWLQLGPATALQQANLFQRPGVTEFVLNFNCLTSTTTVTQASTLCPPTFVAQANNIASGGATNAAPGTTTAQCQVLCLNNPLCVSYQIDLNNPSVPICFLQLGANPLVQSNLFSRPNVVEFVKTLTCLTTATSANTAITQCPPSFIQQPPNTASGGAINLGTSVNLCSATCLANPLCLSYQIQSISGVPTICWIQLTSIASNNIFSNPGLVEFFKTFSCSTTGSGLLTTTTSRASTTSPPCPFIFVQQTPNVASLGATQQIGSTPAQCNLQCLSNSQCIAYQIDSSSSASNPFCWFQLGPLSSLAQNNLFLRNNVVEFFKQQNCPTSSVSAVTQKYS